LIKVLLADDLEIVRSLMRCVLEKRGGMEVLTVDSNGQKAVNATITHCPDVAVLDLSMPTMDGLEAASK
jgi:two-component system, NarL family, invasion response regulator UvrY